jgi:putative phosphotransacetylase
MDNGAIRRLVEIGVLTELAQFGKGYFVPVAVSNRHVHLCAADVDTLFGRGYALKTMRDLNQPGQFACEETVTLTGPKGSIEKLRVLGPARGDTQVEILQSDSFRLGIEPIVRLSGDLAGTPGGVLTGPAGSVGLARGVIVAARHLHMSNKEAGCYGLKNGDIVSVKKGGERSLLFCNVVVRAGEGHSLEAHIDIDEANAAGMLCGELLELIK